MENCGKAVQRRSYCARYNLNLFLARKKLFLARMDLCIVVFWMPYEIVLMTLMTWLLGLICCLTSVKQCHKASQQCYNAAKHTNIIRLLDFVILSHFEAIKIEKGNLLFRNKVYLLYMVIVLIIKQENILIFFFARVPKSW